MKSSSILASTIVLALAGSASAAVVFQNTFDNGFFTPFNPGNATTVKYGDSGWLDGSGSGSGVALEKITLGLAVFNPGDTAIAAGTTDINFTFNSGDPSGLVFGSGATLYSTTITNVALPAGSPGLGTFFSITIPLPGVITAGGFENIGWSIGLSNYNYTGNFGFQAGSAGGQTVGFFTNAASFYNGSSWSLFNFGGPANFVAEVTTPAPTAAGLLGLAGLVATRRRRA